MKWKCTSCGRTARAHPSALPGNVKNCVSVQCAGSMEIMAPPKKKVKGPPKLRRKGPVPGRCPVCLDRDCEDPACLRARGME